MVRSTAVSPTVLRLVWEVRVRLNQGEATTGHVERRAKTTGLSNLSQQRQSIE
jgi:hypothetical protein